MSDALHTFDQVELHKMSNGAAEVLAQMAGTECAKVAVAMLSTLIESYKADLVDVKPENLVRTQACVKQLTELRKVFRGQLTSSPKI